jgi:prolyl-tRNA synthetase
MNEAKLGSLIGGMEVRPMTAEEIEPLFHSPAGYLGPIGLTNIARSTNGKYSEGTLLFVDKALERRKNLIAGANKEDYHVKNIVPGRDFEPTAYADLRNVETGDTCPSCDGILSLDHTVEIGHIFKLGYKYSESMGARVLDKNGKEVTLIMGSYGIGIERILTAAVEQSNDENGFWLPPQIAPFEIVVTPTNVSDAKLLDVAVDLAQKLEAAGFDVLLDDRDERPGVKFKDADLVGIPFRTNVGKKVTEDRVEVVHRSTRTSTDVMIGEAVSYFQSLLRPA